MDSGLDISQEYIKCTPIFTENSPRDNCEPIEQPLHNKQERLTTWRKSKNHESSLEAEGQLKTGGMSESRCLHFP